MEFEIKHKVYKSDIGLKQWYDDVLYNFWTSTVTVTQWLLYCISLNNYSISIFFAHIEELYGFPKHYFSILLKVGFN